MEQIMRHSSSQHSSLFFRTQIKAIQVSQLLQVQGMRLTDNQIKSITNDNLNIFAMTEKLFIEKNMAQLFELIKQLCLNYNSMIVLLSQRLQNESQKNQILQAMKDQRSSMMERSCLGEVSKIGTNYDGVSNGRMNKLGGVKLYNESYSRYIEDKRLLEQIRIEREEHTRKKKKDILNSMIIQEIEKIDAESERDKLAKDEIEQFILECRKNLNFFNYTSYEPELRNIMDFFQSVQNEAKQFLARKGKDERKNIQAQFSFSDFERDVNLGKLEFRRQMIQKVNAFMSKIRLREKQLQTYIEEKEQKMKSELKRKVDVVHYGVQTEIVFEEVIKKVEAERRQLYLKCTALQSLKQKEQFYLHKEVTLQYELNLKQKQFSKLNKKKKQLQMGITTLKKFIKQDRSRHLIPEKDQAQVQEKQSEEDKIVEESNQLIPTSRNFRESSKKRKISSTSEFKSMTQVDTSERQNHSRGHSKVKYAKIFTTSNGFQRKHGSVIARGVSVECAMQTEVDSDVDVCLNNSSSDDQPQIAVSMASKAESRQSVDSIKSKSSKNAVKRKSDIKRKTNSGKQKQNKNVLSTTFSGRKEKKSVEPKIYRSLNRTQPTITTITPQNIKKISTPKSKDSPSRMPEVFIQELRHNSSKKNIYKMFDVLEQKQEELESMYNSERNYNLIQRVGMACEFEKSDTQLQSPMSKIIKKYIKCRFNRLYSIIVCPLKNTVPQSSAVPLIVPQKPQKKKLERKMIKTTTQQSTQATTRKAVEIPQTIESLFSSLPKQYTKGPKNQIINSWRQQLVQKFNEDVLTMEQIEQIVKVLSYSDTLAHKKEVTSAFTTPKGVTVQQNNRNSLPDVNPTDILKYCRPANKKIRSSLHEQSAFSPWRDHFQQQQQINQLIRESAMAKNFASTFLHLHRKCKEGPVCSHIRRYFDTVMKKIKQTRNRERNSMNLHIENIGSLQHQNAIQTVQFSKKVKTESSMKQNLPSTCDLSSITKYTQHSLHKARKSKIGLPVISSHRSSVNK